MVKGLLGVLAEVLFPCGDYSPFHCQLFLGCLEPGSKGIFLFFIENCENHGTKNDMFDEEKRNYLQGVHRILW